MGQTVSSFPGCALADAGQGAGGLPEHPADPGTLPCLSSHNSTEGILDIPKEEGDCTQVPEVNKLKGTHKRSAFVLAFEIMSLAREFGIERLGFLTLTFADLVLDLKEANRRFDSLNTHVIKRRYVRGMVVPERQKSGRLHFHLLVALAADIRRGADFEAFERMDYRSANPALRGEWAFWRVTSPVYGFGRHELLPVRSCAEGIARYVGKYISKNVRERMEADKGARLVRYLGYHQGQGKATFRKASCRFGWNTDNGWLWRHKLAAYAERNGARSTEDLCKLFGPRWAYRLQAEILMERLDTFNGETYRQAQRRSDLSLNMEYPRERVAAIQASERFKVSRNFSRTVLLDKTKVWTKKKH